MNAKHLAAIAVAAVVVIAAAFLLMKRDKASQSSGADSLLFRDFPVNDVTEVKMKGPKEEVRLVKVNETWKVKSCYDYPADFMKMKSFINTVADLKRIQTVKADVTEYGRLGLDLKGGDTAGTMVEFNSASGQKPLVSFIAGKKHSKQAGGADEDGFSMGGWPDGRYLLLPNQQKDAVVVVDKTLDEIDQPAKDWINKDFISARDIMSASLVENGVQQWKLLRKKQGDAMTLESMPEKREIDTSKVSSVSNILGSIRFAEVQSPSLQATDTGLDSPAVFKAETFSGKVYEFQIGKKKDSFRFAKVKVSFQTPPEEEAEKPADETKKDEAAEKKKEEEKAEKIRKAQEEAKAEQEKYSPWTYTFPESSVSPMLSKLEDLLKKVEEKKDEKDKDGAAAKSADGGGAEAKVPK